MILIVSNYSDDYVLLGKCKMNALGELVKQLSGKDFMVKSYSEADMKVLGEHPEITGIILGGSNTVWDSMFMDVYDKEFEIVREANIPILGICGGHQLMAIAYGCGVRRVDFGFEEHVFTEVDIVKDTVLTQGFDGSVYAFESHKCGVYRITEEIKGIMSSVKTPYQGIKVKGESKFGVQFHPELDHRASDLKYKADPAIEPNGNKLLSNFLNLCE